MLVLFFTSMFIAKKLGPEQFGNYNFLVTSFTAACSLIDLGTSMAFYTFASKHKRGINFYYTYISWIGIQFLCLCLFLFLVPQSWLNFLWFGFDSKLLFYVLSSCFLVNQVWQFTAQIGESVRDTIGVQSRNFLLAIIYFLALVLAESVYGLELEIVFYLNIFIYLIFVIFYVFRLRTLQIIDHAKIENPKEIILGFYKYSSPLALLFILGFFYSYFDTWALQHFAGSSEQGFYAVGYRFGSFALIVTVSFLQIFWKELSENYATGNIERVRFLLKRSLRLLYFVTSLATAAAVPYSLEIINLFLGEQYKAASLPLALMFLYPVHNCLNNLLDLTLLATENSRAKSKIGITFMLYSVFATYFLLAPKTYYLPGLDLGAVGISLKMLICQAIQANLSLYIVSKIIKTKYQWAYQFYVLTSLLVLSFLAKTIVLGIFGELTNIISIILGCGLYFIFAAILIYYFPNLCGLSRDELKQYWHQFRNRVLWNAHF